MIVYLVRHGESLAAARCVYQGDDDPLSDLGKKQAEILAQRLQLLSIDVFYSSPLNRARKTAEVISAKTGNPVELWDELREWRNPTEIVGLSLSSPEAKSIKKLIKDNYQKGDWRYSDEETFQELRDRGQKAIKKMLAQKAKKVLCVSHAGIIKMIVTLMVFGDLVTPEIYWNFKYHMHSDYAGLTICKYSPGHGWRVNTWNDTTLL